MNESVQFYVSFNPQDFTMRQKTLLPYFIDKGLRCRKVMEFAPT